MKKTEMGGHYFVLVVLLREENCTQKGATHRTRNYTTKTCSTHNKHVTHDKNINKNDNKQKTL